MSRTRNAARKTACPAAARAGARSEGEETTKVRSKAIESIGGRTVLTVVAAVLALAVFGGAATAVTRTCEADCFGTRKADTLTGNDGGYDSFGKAGRDLVRARGGDDELLGQTGADRLLGGPGAYDKLVGGPGDDEQRGGDGTDLDYFGAGRGKDSVKDDSSEGNRLIFQDSEGDYVTERLLIRSTPGPGPEATTADGGDSVVWAGDPFDYVVGGEGNDEIVGDGGGGRISPMGGDDDVFANGGDDEVLAHADGGGDAVDCGEGDDEVYYDLGDQISVNCEEQHAVVD